MSEITNSIFGLLGDHLPNTDYKKRSNEMERFGKYLLGKAGDFGCKEFTEKFEGKDVFNEKTHHRLIMPILEDYEEFIIFDGLANKLAWRDFRRDHSEAEMREMGKKNGGYFGVALYNYEKKYWDEFKKHDYERLEIKEK